MAIYNTILAQTMTGTVLVIIVLLLVAGLIGYLTSYYYYRGIYGKKIHILESDLKDLHAKNEDLQDQVIGLNKKLEEKEKKSD